MPTIHLTAAEVRVVTGVATSRHVANIIGGRVERYGKPKAEWDPAIVGCIGEYAAAKATGLFWSLDYTKPVYTGDLAGRVEVRSTPLLDGCLVGQDGDHDDRPYILVCGIIPSREGWDVRIPGWALGRDIKQPQWWRTDVERPAYYLPQRQLRPIATLATVAQSIPSPN